MMSTTTCSLPVLTNAPLGADAPPCIAASARGAAALAAGACTGSARLLAADGCGVSSFVGAFVPAAVYVGNAVAGVRLSDTTAAGVCTVGFGAAGFAAAVFVPADFAAAAVVRLAVTEFCAV